MSCCNVNSDFMVVNLHFLKLFTVFDVITAPALIIAPPPMTFYFIFTYHRPLDDLFLDFYFIFTYYRPLDNLLALVVENKYT